MENDSIIHKSRFTLKDTAKIIDTVLLIFSIILLVLLVGDYFWGDQYRYIYSTLYTLLWIAFTIEFFIKWFLAKNKIEFLKDDFFVVLIVIFPFLRPFRFFSLSRLGLLVFADQANERFPIFKQLRMLELLLVSIVLVILSADLFLQFEKNSDTLFKNFGDALWFSVVTVATVGYGDVYPKSTNGRILAVFLIIFGVSIFGIVTASISSYLVEKDIKDERKHDKDQYEALFNEEKLLESRMESILEQEERLNYKIDEFEKKIV